MDIIVQGTGEITVKPNKITLLFDFRTKDKIYKNVLKNGVENVETYLNLLIKLGFSKEQVKTRSFKVSEDRIYNEKTRKYISDGFLYTQNARLEFDYDMDKLSELMEKTSKISNPPSYKIDFSVKDDKKLEEELLANAYKEAEFQAKAIAKACGKTKTITCKKVSFEPFDEKLNSETRYEGMAKMAASFDRSVSESVQHIFIPEDIKAKTTIYCLFEVC